MLFRSGRHHVGAEFGQLGEQWLGRRRQVEPVGAAVVRIVPVDDLTGFGRLLASAGVRPRVGVENPDGSSAIDVSVYRYRHANGTVLALERTDGGTEPRRVVLTLPHGITRVHDLLGGAPERTGEKLTVTLRPVEPSILLLSHASNLSR